MKGHETQQREAGTSLTSKDRDWAGPKKPLEQMPDVIDPNLDRKEHYSLFKQHIVRVLLEPRPKECTNHILDCVAFYVRGCEL